MTFNHSDLKWDGSDSKDAASTRPILGGDTSVTLISAATLQSLGVSVTALGSASLDAPSGDPVASFPITGGTDEAGNGSAVILHQGSGLKLAAGHVSVQLEDFRIDTANGVIDANVTVNGTSAGNVAVFDIGEDLSLTLTRAAAGVVGTAFGTEAITPEVTIGVADPEPVISPAKLGLATGDDFCLPFLHPASSDTKPIIGGETAVTLTSAATLQSLGVAVKPLGSATLDGSGVDPVAAFPITGGTEGPDKGEAVILHQGSGLELSDADGTVVLRDFLIDTANGVVDANVTLNGTAAGNLPVFDIGPDLALMLTTEAADAVSATLGAPEITSDVRIGVAATSPTVLPFGHVPWPATAVGQV